MAQMVFEQNLEKLFLLVLNMSLTSCVVILAVLIARLALKRTPTVFSYTLWAVVLFRLLCPVSFSLPVSLLGVLRNAPAEAGRMEYIAEDIGYMARPEIMLPAPGLNSAVNELLPPAAPAASANPIQIYLQIGAYLWLLGILGMGIYSVLSVRRLRKQLKGAVLEEGNIYRIAGNASPFVYGLFSPRIYLPGNISGEERPYVLLHEQIHIRRGDAVFRLLAYLALWLHWFNPLVWLAFELSGRDMEMSCDEAVILRLGGKVKKEYSASLLNMAAGSRIAKGIPIAFGEGGVGSRIKNVLRYRKPAALFIGAAAVFSIALAVFLIANPAKNSNIFYGVVTEAAGQDNAAKTVVRIPRIGDVELPEADEVSLYLERDAEEMILTGDLLRITFSPDLEIRTEAADSAGQTLYRFVSAPFLKAEKIQVMGEGFSMTRQEEDTYLFGVPLGMADEAKAGDILLIYHIPDVDTTQEIYFLMQGEQELLTSTEVLSVDKENYDILVELTGEEVEVFLSEFGFGLTAALETTAVSMDTEDFLSEFDTGLTAALEPAPPLQTEDLAKGGAVTPVYANVLSDDTGSELMELSPELLRNGELLDGTYVVNVCSMSVSARGFDQYVTWEDETDLPLLPFAENCKFKVNWEWEKISYSPVSFDQFADLITRLTKVTNPAVYCEVADNIVVTAALESAYNFDGISYERPVKDTWPEYIERSLGMAKEEALAEYYVLNGTVTADIADSAGNEAIEIYTGNVDGDESGVGVVLFKDSAGKDLGTESAHTSRAGWNNVYIGKADGTGFILTVHIEDRDTYGGYEYQVFRFGENGEIKQIAGSGFTFGTNFRYDDDTFHKWADNLSYYLERSYLILSSQEGEIRTERVSEADRYNYETLRRKR